MSRSFQPSSIPVASALAPASASAPSSSWRCLVLLIFIIFSCSGSSNKLAKATPDNGGSAVEPRTAYSSSSGRALYSLDKYGERLAKNSNPRRRSHVNVNCSSYGSNRSNYADAASSMPGRLLASRGASLTLRGGGSGEGEGLVAARSEERMSSRVRGPNESAITRTATDPAVAAAAAVTATTAAVTATTAATAASASEKSVVGHLAGDRVGVITSKKSPSTIGRGHRSVGVRGLLLAKMRAGGGRNSTGEKMNAEGSKEVSARWPLLSAFLYFLAISFTIPVLPKVVNELFSGSTAVTAASATAYALLSSTDAAFTLLTVNFHASMSDKYGRRPFLALSALGLGTGFFITYSSRKVWLLMVAAAIDGCTSCMYSMAQACITDCVGKGPRLSQAFGLFQGLSLGMAFMLGLPLGGIIGAKFGVRVPLLISVGLSALNFLMIVFAMPETLEKDKRKAKVELKQANPLGAMRMATRNKLITGMITCWTLLWIAHVGLQINWINYTDRKFQWGVAQSGASLAMMGLLVAIFPMLIIPRLGLERSISYGLFTYAVGQLVIATAPGVKNQHRNLGTPFALVGLGLTSAGSITFPSILAYLSNQVGEEEVGALQGTTDTAKTICSVVFGPAMAWIFGYFISDHAYPRKIEGANYYVGMVVAFSAWVSIKHTFSKHGKLDKVPPSERDGKKNAVGFEMET